MQIFIHKDGQKLGPFEVADVEAGIIAGRFTETDLGWYEGAQDWTPLKDIPELDQVRSGLGDSLQPAPKAQPATEPKEPPTTKDSKGLFPISLSSVRQFFPARISRDPADVAKLSRLLLIIMLGAFVYQLYNLTALRYKLGVYEELASVLVTEGQEHYSTPNMIAMLGKSLFDGITLGEFSEEGIFTEANKEKRYREMNSDTRTKLEFAYNRTTREIQDAGKLRNLSVFGSIGSFIAMRIFKKRTSGMKAPESVGNS